MTDAAPDRIRTLEELAFNAWPALQTLVVDGWLLRFAEGFTKRANSANAWRPGPTPLAEIVSTAETLYRARGLRPIFRLSPLAPAGADELLARRGYHRFDETGVQHAAIAEAGAERGVVLADTPSDAWLAGYAAATGLADAQRETLGRMLLLCHLPCAFASIDVDGGPAAFGYAVRERGHVGLFDIVTAPAQRRRGLARRVVGALLHWGAAHGAARAYLQVVDDNAPALALYRDLGFTQAYRYHYRVAPA
jgi:ribosomal protein S18 acetylase RimI-like enzyme